MKVSEIMSRSVKTVTPKTPFRELWKAIFHHHIHALPVTGSKNIAIGIISEEDLLKPLYPDYVEYVEDFTTISNFEELENKVHDLIGLTAADVMNTHIIFTRPETPILRALSRMIVRDVRQLPVVSDEGVIVGMVSKGDIFDSIFRKYMQNKSDYTEAPITEKKPVRAKKSARPKKKSRN